MVSSAIAVVEMQTEPTAARIYLWNFMFTNLPHGHGSRRVQA
jgi:hypothetical protein